MGGSIKSDKGSKCLCGGKFKQIKMLERSVPVCDKGGGHPNKLRVDRYILDLDGVGRRIIIRFDHKNKRLTKINQAIMTLEFIDYEIEEGKFDPRKYANKAVSNQLKFKYFVENKYLRLYEAKLKSQQVTPSYLKNKISICKNHITPFFGELDIRVVSSGKIREFHDSFTDRLRTRDKAIQELGCILRYAMDLEHIDKMPVIPRTKRAKYRNVENFPTPLEQEKIINAIGNPTYRAMIKILAIYAMRPCEVRALKVKDLKNKIITIRRHFSDGNKLIDGRKGQSMGENLAIHYLPFVDDFVKVLNEIEIPKDEEAFLFKGMRSEFVSENVLRIAWNAACKEVGVTKCQLYEGTKHSRISSLKQAGYSDEELIVITGHTNIETIKRYSQLTRESRLAAGFKVLNGSRKSDPDPTPNKRGRNKDKVL